VECGVKVELGKTAIFGGAFDPVHNGHTALVSALCAELDLSEIIVIPAGDHPFKKSSAPAADRLEMCRSAFKDFPGVSVSDYEIRQSKPSYTYKTLRHFHKTFGSKPYFIVGTDALAQILSWKKPDLIARHGVLITVCRAHYDHVLQDAAQKYSNTTGGEILISKSIVPDISSTEVRILNSFGSNLSPYLCQSVINYIREHNLYMQYADVAQHIKGLVDGERYLHTASTACAAYKLAQRYGADPATAVRAALYHDCAKNIVTEDDAKKHGLDVPPEVFALHRKIRHGPIGALYARKYFNEMDPDVLNAIGNHTTGRSGMSLLEKIIFVADYIDPLRAYDDSPAMCELAFSDLDAVIRCKYAEIKAQKAKAT